MNVPTTTAVFAALLALLYVGLSGWVIAARTSHGVLHGDGGNLRVEKRMRSHADSGEYVPLAIVLVGLLEVGGAAGAAASAPPCSCAPPPPGCCCTGISRRCSESTPRVTQAAA